MRRLISDDENHVETVLWDIDGVLADIAHRLPLCPGRPGVPEHATWEDYHAAGVRDAPIPGSLALLRLMWRSGYNNVLVTNRPESAREATEAWLIQHEVFYHQLFMREDGGNHGSKEWVLERLHLPTVVLAVDDDARHGEMYTKNGIPFLYIESGYYTNISDEQYYGSHYAK